VSTRTADDGEGALAGAAFAMVAQLTTAVFTAVMTLYLVRALGPRDFGVLALVFSVGSIAVVLSDAALAQSTSRYLAERVDDRLWVADALSAGLRLKLFAGVFISATLFALAPLIADAYGAKGMTTSLRIMSIAVLGESVLMLWTNALQAARRVAASVRLTFIEGAVEAGATIALVAVGGGVAGAALGRGIGYVVGAIAGAALVARRVGGRLRVRSVEPGMRRRIGTYAGPLLLNTSAYTVYSQVDIQLVGALLTQAAVGILAAPFKIITLLCYPGQSVANAVSPRMAGDSPDVASFTTAFRWLLIYQTALIPPVVVWAQPITHVMLGPGFERSAAVLAALSPYLFLRGVSVLASTTVNYLGYARRRIPIVLTSLAVMVIIDLLLLPTIGLLGATVGLGASYAVYVPLHLRLCHESLHLPLRHLARTAIRCGAAALVMAAVLAAFGRHHLTGLQWFFGGTAAFASYTAVLVISKELDVNDLRELRSVVTRVRRRLSRHRRGRRRAERVAA
jgi:O-antigen/teichoic acid export membrane protein